MRHIIASGLLATLTLSLSAFAADSVLWHDSNRLLRAHPDERTFQQRVMEVDEPALLLALQHNAFNRPKGGEPVFASLPLPDGTDVDVRLESSPLHEGADYGVADRHSYKVYGKDGRSLGRVSTGSFGLYGYLTTPDGDVYIERVDDPDAGPTTYRSFYRSDYVASHADLRPHYRCGKSHDVDPLHEMKHELRARSFTDAPATYAARSVGSTRVYRLAVATTGEYSQKIASGDVSFTRTEIDKALTVINAIYERDVGIRFRLVFDNDRVIFTDPDTDPFTDIADIAAGDYISNLLDENQTVIDERIGSANYDVGHVFGDAGGGLAALGAACIDGFKAQGGTGVPNSSVLRSDVFYVDLVAHELGHQLGAEHTFNGTTGNCAGENRSAGTAFEPGSGNTIMAYAGICDNPDTGEDENIQTLADPFFHAGSIDQIMYYTRESFGDTCGSDQGITNARPVVDAGADFMIPVGTAFTLLGTATDTDAADTLSYQWTQMDVGTETDGSTFGKDLGDNPLFKVDVPTMDDGERTFPDIALQVANTDDPAEVLPGTSRAMRFRLLVRDGKGGVDHDDMILVSNKAAGPFRVIQPNTAVTLDYTQPQLVEWDAACTDIAPVDCAEVDILLSTDGGATYNDAFGKLSTPNDGAEAVMFPTVDVADARIMVRCSDNVFLDISDEGFTVSSAGSTLSESLEQRISCAAVAPVFSSARSVSVVENVATSVYRASASDGNGDAITYAVSGGVDAALFRFDTSNNGYLSFRTAPNYESPKDSDGDNIYEVNISATDSSTSRHMTIHPVKITVTDVAEDTSSGGSLGILTLLSMLIALGWREVRLQNDR